MTLYSFYSYLIVWKSHIDIVVCLFALYPGFPPSGWMLWLFDVLQHGSYYRWAAIPLGVAAIPGRGPLRNTG